MKTLQLLSLALAVVLCNACAKDNDRGANTSHKVIFKATASSGSTLDLVVYGYDASLTTASGIGGTQWSAEITVPPNATVASIVANARGANAASLLKVQVYVDGSLKKEGTSTGTALSATAQYNFN